MSRNPESATYTHGHHASVLRSHTWRTALNSAAYLLPHLRPDMKILDIGCGPGTITIDLAGYVPEGHVTGVDQAGQILDQARALATERGVTNVDFAAADANRLDYADESYDVVICHQVLQHVKDPVGVLREMRRVAKTGGIVAARETDFGTMTWYPQVEGMNDWLTLYYKVVAHNGGEANAGRMVHAWARRAGFSAQDISCSSSTWCYSTPDEIAWWSGLWADRTVESDFATTAVEAGLATEQELRETAEVWRSWGGREDAWFSFLHGEVICRKREELSRADNVPRHVLILSIHPYGPYHPSVWAIFQRREDLVGFDHRHPPFLTATKNLSLESSRLSPRSPKKFTMGRLLTGRQADELHKSLIAYLQANNMQGTAAALRSELGLEEQNFDAETTTKYESLLEKKWTSTVLDLESRNATLQSELELCAPSASSKRVQDPVTWLPRSPPHHSLESHRETVNCVAFHPVFSSIASGSDDCTVKIWDWEFGELERTIKSHTRAVRDVDFGGPKGAVLLASCSSDLTIKLWDPAAGYNNIRTLQGHEHSISAVRFIPPSSGKYANMLVSASGDQNIKIWDTTTGICVKTLQGHTGWVRHISPSSDGRFLLSTGNDRTVRLWDISKTQPENTLTMTGHDNVINCCALAPPTSYQYLAAIAGSEPAPTKTSGTAEYMATGSRDKTIKIWDARGTCILTLVGHDNWVSALAFHPGGRHLLSVADDKTLRCWDLSQGGKCVKVLQDIHEQFITCLRWAPEPVKSVANGESPGGRGSAKAETSAPQIRCVIATGSMDSSLKIFANK
ncbi:hypothetical protein CP533_1236 [Ophiocordyceps camponoti-saundersi (nom. inval.)]|nr:hypothetical protein CP533_1236 [Ophiocordyceps camponoti-saundersi (nom. inval.)]